MTRYITTPLYYVNDLPHIGHAYTTIAADVWARARRLFGENVFFLTGTDEHGGKIAQAARASSLDPQAYTDKVAQAFQDLWKDLLITNDDFIRTTQPRHTQVVQAVFTKLQAQGDLIKGVYEDWYCTPCETFLSVEELVQGQLCPNCQRPVEKLREEGCFFRLSHYAQKLKELYKNSPDFLSPKSRAKEIANFVEAGLEDLSVTRSRERVAWGVPVPGDPRHTIYVWFDALLNYISAIGYSPDASRFTLHASLFEELWPATVQLVGKEIFRFHAVIWPAMLMALGLEPPKKVFAHGWWTVEGVKMSKSKGNVVSPKEILKTYSADAFRYCLFREMPFGNDGDFSIDKLKEKTNQELANDFGNLHLRLFTMAEKYFSGRLVKKGLLNIFTQVVSQRHQEVNTWCLNLEFFQILQFVHSGLAHLNAEINERTPWRLFSSGKNSELEAMLFDWSLSLAYLAYLLAPFCPISCEKLLVSFGLEPKPKDFLEYLTQLTSLEFVSAKKEPLFKKL